MLAPKNTKASAATEAARAAAPFKTHETVKHGIIVANRKKKEERKATDVKTPPPSKKEGAVLKDPSTCKGKPTKTKGNGGSRAFVPWCNKR